MEAVFLKIVNMSIMASYVVVALLLLRPLLRKAPQWMKASLWLAVGIRLVLPLSFESSYGIVYDFEDMLQNTLSLNADRASSLGAVADSYIGSSLSVYTNSPDMNYKGIILFVCAVIWILGVISMLAYAIVSYVKLKKSVSASVPIKDNTYLCDYISSPFILDVAKPKIYIPSDTDKENITYIIAHERAHIERFDQLWKPIAFILLSIYWFNPAVWLAYGLLCRDIELACDEKVLKVMGIESKKPYSKALINCSAPRSPLFVCRLAFGEVSVKKRIKTILEYKNPTFWRVATGFLICLLSVLTLLTNSPDPVGIFYDRYYSEIEYEGEIFREVDYKAVENLTDKKYTAIYPRTLLVSSPLNADFFTPGEKEYIAALDEWKTAYGELEISFPHGYRTYANINAVEINYIDSEYFDIDNDGTKEELIVTNAVTEEDNCIRLYLLEGESTEYSGTFAIDEYYYMESYKEDGLLKIRTTTAGSPKEEKHSVQNIYTVSLIGDAVILLCEDGSIISKSVEKEG